MWASNNYHAASERCSTDSFSKIQDGNFHRFNAHHDNLDNEVDEISPSHSLLVNEDVSGDRRKNYGSTLDDSGEIATLSDSTTQFPEKPYIDKLPFAMVNIIVLLMQASGRFHSPVMSQYLYQSYADDILGNASVKTSSHPCLNDSTTDPSTVTNVRRVQQLTSEMMMALDLCNYCLGIPACLLFGIFANSLNRKLILLTPASGYLVKCAIITGVVCWRFPVKWFFLGYIVEGVLGSVGAFFLGVYLYTSDITTRGKTRTFGVSVVEGLKGLLAAGINTVSGQLIEKTGFLIPAMLSLACSVLSLVCILLLPNRKRQIQPDHLEYEFGPLFRWYKRLTAPFNSNSDVRVRKLVAIGWITFFLALASVVGVAKIESIYIMNLPFCFDAETVGWYLFGRELAYYGFLIAAVPLLYSCMPGMWLGILGSVSIILGNIMYAAATTKAGVFHVIGLAIGQALPVSIIRGEMSSLFGSETQGSLFAGFAVMECTAYAAGTAVMSVYRASLGIFKGLPFVVFAVVMVAVVAMLTVYQVIWKRHLVHSLVTGTFYERKSRTLS